MVKYNWTKYTLEDRLEKLNNALLFETDTETRNFIHKDITYITNYLESLEDNDYYYESCSLLDGYNYIEDDYSYAKFLWNDFKEFKENTMDIIPNIYELKRNSLSKDDILSLTHDFYKSLDSYFYGNFMKNFYRRRDHIVFHNNLNETYFGETLILNYFKEHFIEIYRAFNIEDVFSCIHEYEHATSAMINPYHCTTDQKALFCEIDTIFMELIATDYLKEITNAEETTKMNIIYHGRYCNNAKVTNDFINLSEYEKQHKRFSNNKELKKVAKQTLGLEPIEIELMIQYPLTNPEIYLTSYIFAIELYYLYKEDKEKALYTLKKLILLNDCSEIEYYNNIKALGLYPNLHTRDIHKDIIEKSKTLARKIK